MVSSAKQREGRRAEKEEAGTRARVIRICSERKRDSSCFEVEKTVLRLGEILAPIILESDLFLCLRMPSFSNKAFF